LFAHYILLFAHILLFAQHGELEMAIVSLDSLLERVQREKADVQRRSESQLDAARSEVATLLAEEKILRTSASANASHHKAMVAKLRATVEKLRDMLVESRARVEDGARLLRVERAESATLRAAAAATTTQVSVLLYTVTFYANLAHSLTRSP
jgi:hypothetical protein